MGFITQIAVSGLIASGLRVTAAANNIANADTDNYKPKTVEQVSSVDGVKAKIVERNDGFNPFAPKPLVNLDQELVDVARASQAYKASALLVKTDKELSETLIDVFSKDD